MAGIVDRAKLEAARTTFETVTEQVFSQRADGPWSSFTKVFSAGSDRSLTLNMAGATPVFEEWTASKSFSGFRAYKKTVNLSKYHASMKMDRMDVEYDGTGIVGERIRNFVADSAYIWDRLVTDDAEGGLLSNPTGIDGVSLLNDSHPHGNGGTWDNKVTTALGYASLNTGLQFGRTLKDEKGEFLGIDYNTLMVGPDLERLALEITGADTRPIGISTAGEIVASGATLSESIMNVYRGRVNVIVNKRFDDGSHDTDWLLLDSRYPAMGLLRGSGPRPVMQDRPEDDMRFHHDQVAFSLEFDAKPFGYLPYGVYGKLS